MFMELACLRGPASVKTVTVLTRVAHSGAMSAHILDRKGGQMQQLPSTGPARKLLMEQRVFYQPPGSDEIIELSSHVSTHGRTHPYMFKPIGRLVGCLL